LEIDAKGGEVVCDRMEMGSE